MKGNEARRCFSRCLRAFRSPPSGNPGYRCVASLWNVGFLARRLDPLLFRKRRHYQKGASPGKRRGRISAPLRHVPCACGIGIAEKTKGGMSLLQRIAAARGDLTGDGRLETVTLFGVRPAGSIAWQQITLEIEDGATHRRTRLPLPQDAGYDPQIILGHMISRAKEDVLISVDSGGSGGVGYYTVYSWQDGTYRMIFDSESFAAAFPYMVTYQDQYVVRAESPANGMVYLIDISGRDEAYLREIYDEDGRLLHDVEGFVDPISLLYPADVNRDGLLELVAWQRISGLFHADGLGVFFNTLASASGGTGFELSTQTVGIFGTPRS